MGEFDVIVVGAGPAGSVAAHTLARSGLRVALLDRTRFPRPKLCGGLLTWKSVRLLETKLGLDVASLHSSGVINYSSDMFSIFGPQRMLVAGRLSSPFHFTDRSHFDATLLECAARQGAEVFEETQVVACDPNTGIVTTESGLTFKGRFVVGADGVNSSVRACFPEKNRERERWQEYLAPAIEVSFDIDNFPKRVDHPELHVGHLEAGYGWVFPNRHRVIVGICGLRREKVNFSNVFRKYLEYLGIKDPDAVELKGHPLPYGNYLEKPCHGRALLVGDAGGLVEPLFGEGIFYGMASGLYAGQSIVEAMKTGGKACIAYQEYLQSQIFPELKASDRLRWLLFRSVCLLGDASLGLFVRPAVTRLGDMVHGKRSYRWTMKKKWDFLE